MRVLVIGSGAREHALLRALNRDPAVTDLHVAPGNAGTGALAAAHPVDVADPSAIAELAAALRADLVVIGPELPLVNGAADAVAAAGIPVFGPTAAAARIEGSKAFAKDVMLAAGIPTAAAVTVRTATDIDAALDSCGAPYVVKDDGLAAGKGVVVTADREIAIRHALAVLEVGRPVLVEEFLAGPEVSLFALCDGIRAVPLLPAQDFKRRSDGDTGPNTGGMGAYAPLDWVPAGLVDRVQREVLDPVLAEMAARDSPFLGLLYVGLVLTADGPKVIEFNCRFGDPETQVVLELLDSPLGQLLAAAAAGDLTASSPPCWKSGSAVAVVVAAQGYPETPIVGDLVVGADQDGILHAGTQLDADGAVRSSGGRVVSATATGADLGAARAAAYALVETVQLRGAQYRSDIAAAAAAGRVSTPAAGPTPAPAAGLTPVLAAGPTPAPAAGLTPVPAAGPTPAPAAGPTPAPAAGLTRVPAAGPTTEPVGNGVPLFTPATRAAVAPFHVMRVLAAAARRAETGAPVYNLTVGQPSTPAPAPVLAAARQALGQQILGYTETPGIAPLRAAIAGHYRSRYHLDVDPAEVFVTTGSSGGFLLAFLAAFDSGDRVGVPRPGYPAYRNILQALGCRLVDLPCGASTRFQPTVEMIAELDLQGLVLASPANPTGTSMEPAELAAMAAFCATKGIRLISDEIYHGINYTSEPACSWSTDRSGIVVNSFSKYFSMTGWRLGWLLVPGDLADPVDALAGNLAICPPALAQYAAVSAFQAYSECDAYVARYAVNRGLLLDGLRALGIDRLAPADGAFYVYADVSHLTDDTQSFCRRLLDESGVAVAPGVDFDPVDGHRSIRLSFAGSAATITEGLAAFGAFLSRG